MKKAFIFLACLVPVLGTAMGLRSPFVSRDLSGDQARAKLPEPPVT